MKIALPLFVAALLAVPLHAKDPARVDPAQRNENLAPTPDSADTRLSPQRESNQRAFIRNEVLQEQRFRTPELIDRKDAVVGEKRAPITVAESREKTIIERKDYPRTPEVRENKMNRHDGERSRIQPSGDMVKNYGTVAKYQDSMADAKNTTFKRQPSLEKRTTFDKINRFVFKRNGPGSEDRPVVTPAAGGPAPAGLDTYQRYQVDWKRLDSPR